MSFAAPMAHFYDLLNDGADYGSESSLICSHLSAGARTGLDLGCGTGSLALLLSEKFDMTGVDLSEEMLAAADEKAYSARQKVRFVCQNIVSLSLGQTFDFCLCLHDTLNYLKDTAQLALAFSRIFAHLKEDGVFLFDFNTPERFWSYDATPCEILEREGLFCAWERVYHRKRGVCDFAFHFFEEKADGSYERSVEYERQRSFSQKTVEKLCREAGFFPELIGKTEEHFIYKATKQRG